MTAATIMVRKNWAFQEKKPPTFQRSVEDLPHTAGEEANIPTQKNQI